MRENAHEASDNKIIGKYRARSKSDLGDLCRHGISNIMDLSYLLYPPIAPSLPTIARVNGISYVQSDPPPETKGGSQPTYKPTDVGVVKHV
jgi:hypothetical protein